MASIPLSPAMDSPGASPPEYLTTTSYVSRSATPPFKPPAPPRSKFLDSSDSQEDAMLNKMTPHSVCVLYDPKDGRVVHTHQIAFAGAALEIADEEVEATTRERARQFGHNVD